MKHFKDCETLEDVRRLYKELAKQHHPDRGGDTATMQEINTEYAFVSAKILRGEQLSAEDTEANMRFSEDYQRIIEKISHLEGITIEVVGNWIWVIGNTYPVRKELKEAGLYFAPIKKQWYYRSEEFKVYTRGKQFTYEEIKEKYGSKTVTKNSPKSIN